jgi:uncharacterized protein YdeI (YjbR/CyaY-like superfamily)
LTPRQPLSQGHAMVQTPTFFATEADFRSWLAANHITEPELLVGFWKKGSGKPSIDWPQARDQALCFGWIDGIRKSLGDEAYTIRFTPRRRGSIWSKVNVARYEALAASEQKLFRGNKAAWADWEKRPPGYRKVVLHWITSAKREGTRAKRLATLIEVSAKGERIPGYDWQKKP